MFLVQFKTDYWKESERYEFRLARQDQTFEGNFMYISMRDKNEHESKSNSITLKVLE